MQENQIFFKKIKIREEEKEERQHLAHSPVCDHKTHKTT